MCSVQVGVNRKYSMCACTNMWCSTLCLHVDLTYSVHVHTCVLHTFVGYEDFSVLLYFSEVIVGCLCQERQ